MSDEALELDFVEVERVGKPVPRGAYQGVAVLWALRILVRLHGVQRFKSSIMDEEEFLRIVGVGDYEETPPLRKLKRLLRRRLAVFEARAPRRLGVLRKNLRMLAPSLKLTPTDCAILAFSVILCQTGWLQEAASSLGELDTRGMEPALATILALPERDIHAALASTGALACSGIIHVATGAGRLKEKLELFDSFADALSQEQASPAEMLKPFFRIPEAPLLKHGDFQYAEDEWSLVTGYLAAKAAKPAAGVNILIYGRPGTGKTEFVRTLAAELGLDLREVAVHGAEGGSLRPEHRLGAYLLAERVLCNTKKAVVLFDEVEDAFPGGRWGLFREFGGGEARIGKAWMNRVLEENPVPSFWLSNDIEQIDRAYLRRFDLVFEMPEPPRSARRRILCHYLKGIAVSEPWLDRVAENRDLVPAVIERAAKVVGSLKLADAAQAEKQLAFTLRGNLTSMGRQWIAPGSGVEPIHYRLEYLNPDSDLDALCTGLKRRVQGRLCLYGPPGTGKTAFGKHVGKLLDRPVLVKRASDLLSMWVGESEKNIAHMFREAEHEGAVLMLDEADSFLQDRAGATRSWEVTQVNELLTQMEAFDGLFIASTNLMDNLDAASLRRFDFKIRFRYLTPPQREAMFADILMTLGNTAERANADVSRRLERLDTLTPGDFAVAMRQARLLGTPPSADKLCAVLETECAFKDKGVFRVLGFAGAA
ncbi:MAG: AAA family ATPase [Gammaproteobacteria bacterium]